MENLNGNMVLDVSMLQLLVYVAIPFVVDLVTKRFANADLKAGVVAVLAILAAVVQELVQTGADVTLNGLASKFVTALVTSFVFHQYVWKPVGVTGDEGVIQKAVPAGVGSVDPVKEATGTVKG